MIKPKYILNPIDKIYTEKTGLPYPVSASAGGGPVPPVESKVNITNIKIKYEGNFSSFYSIWSVPFNLEFLEEAPENWSGTFEATNVYHAIYGDQPHANDEPITFDANTDYGDHYETLDPVWLIGDNPTSVTFKIFDGDGNLWTTFTTSNFIVQPEVGYFNISNAVLEGTNTDVYDFSCDTSDLNFNNLPSGWVGSVKYYNGEGVETDLFSFNVNNVDINNSISVENLTLTNLTGINWIYVHIYQSNDIELYQAGNSITINPYVAPSFFRVENMTNNNNNVTITKNGTPSTGTDLAYSKDGRNFTTCEYTNNVCTITLGAHEKVYLRSTTGLSQSDTNYYSIGSSAAIEVAGDIKSLIDYTDGQLGTAQSYGFYKLLAGNTNGMVSAIDFSSITTLNDHCYFGMFENCTGLTVASPLPATTLAASCYEEMFKGCTALTTIPTTLPATTLTVDCYKSMFEGCTYISYIPTLPATTLASTCYEGMFRGCVRLSDLSAKELPAVVLTNSCYREMFKGCTSMTATPDILADTLAEHCCHGMYEGCTSLNDVVMPGATVLTENCFNSMFKGCTSLEIGEVPATTLAEDSLDDMFNSCSSLIEIGTQATEWNESYANNWVQGVAASGTFYNDGCADIPTGVNGIPTGWTEEKPEV